MSKLFQNAFFGQRVLGLLLVGVISALLAVAARAATVERQPPNFVIIFADDLGYGDLGCYGHPTIRTPRLDRMAREGMRFTQFYSAACVCTPSRAALLTGRLPIRSGMCHDRYRVLRATATGGIPADEVLLPELLRTRGYVCACIGKWHLGSVPEYLPLRHGFDRFFGLPYSNDMGHINAWGKTNQAAIRRGIPPLPLYDNLRVVETEPDQRTLTRRYTEKSIEFIRQAVAAGKPFFLYLPHSFPHVPLFADPEFAGKSRRGLYGDVVRAIDWSTGVILDTLHELGVADNTLVFFTSDNGPWLNKREHGGSAGLLRDGKGSTWEGGMREPGIAWWPGHVPAGVTTAALGCTMDLFVTCAVMAGASVPTDRVIDGYDLSPVLLRNEASPRKEMFFYRGTRLMAVRLGPWKAHFKTQAAYGQREPQSHDPPLLYHLEHDPSERFDVAKEHPKIVAEIKALVQRHQSELKPAPSRLE